GQGTLDLRVIARPLQHFDPDIGRKWRPGAEQADPVVPVVVVGAGNRRDRLALVDGAEQRAPDRRVVKWRMQLIKGHDAVRRREMRDDGDVRVAGDSVDEIARRVLPPVNLALAQRRFGRERIQGQPLDAIEMNHLRPCGEADFAAVARSVLRELGEHRARAADMLILQKPEGAAADNLGYRLEWRFLRQTLRHNYRR